MGLGSDVAAILWQWVSTRLSGLYPRESGHYQIRL